MSEISSERTKVFISYSHQDAEWLRRLRVHLKPLEREHRLEIWDDTRIKPGSRWRNDIQKALATTKVAVLLVSADFLASEFIAADELPPLLSAAQEEGATILPLILSPSRFSRNAKLSQFQAVNDPSRPLIGMSKNEQEAVLVRVTEAIEVSFNYASKVKRERLQNGEATPDHGAIESIRNVGSMPAAETSMVHKKRTVLSKIHPTIWVAAIAGVVAIITGYWQFVYKAAQTNTSAQSQSASKSEYAGQVLDGSEPIYGASVQIRDEQGNIQISKTDSVGRFQYSLRPSTASAHFIVTVEGYEEYERDLPPQQTGREPFILKHRQPPPTPTVSVQNRVTSPQRKVVPKVTRKPQPSPCSAEDRLLGKC